MERKYALEFKNLLKIKKGVTVFHSFHRRNWFRRTRFSFPFKYFVQFFSKQERQNSKYKAAHLTVACRKHISSQFFSRGLWWCQCDLSIFLAEKDLQVQEGAQ